MAELYKDLTELFNCDVCLNQLQGSDPRTLQCGHIFCSGCLQTLLDDQLVTCPMCRQETRLADGSVASLPRSFVPGQVNDILDKLRNRISKCSVCVIGDVKYFCLGCPNAFCNECMDIHDKRPKKKSHERVEVDGNSIMLFVCQDHLQFLTEYCTQCVVGLCAKCCPTDHVDHTIYGFRIQDSSASQYVTDLQTHKQEIQTQKQNLEAQREKYVKHLLNILGKIDDNEKQLMKSIKQRADRMRNELIKTATVADEQLEKHQQDLTQQEADLIATEAAAVRFISPIDGVPQVALEDYTPPILKPSSCSTLALPGYTFQTRETTIRQGFLKEGASWNFTEYIEGSAPTLEPFQEELSEDQGNVREPETPDAVADENQTSNISTTDEATHQTGTDGNDTSLQAIHGGKSKQILVKKRILMFEKRILPQK